MLIGNTYYFSTSIEGDSSLAEKRDQRLPKEAREAGDKRGECKLACCVEPCVSPSFSWDLTLLTSSRSEDIAGRKEHHGDQNTDALQ